MSGQATRLHYLDAVRAFVMSIGVVLHAGLIERFWLSGFLNDLSGLFRMKLFFLIGGFFAALLVDRRGLAAVRSERLVRYGLPLLTGVLLLNPIANFFFYQVHVGPISAGAFFASPPAWNLAGFAWGEEAKLFMTWHGHLWFLVVVALYCLALGPFLAIADSEPVRRGLAWMIAPERGKAMPMLVLSFGMVMAFLAMRAAHLVTTQQLLSGSPLNFVAQNAWLYMPYFLIGILAYKSAEPSTSFTKSDGGR